MTHSDQVAEAVRSSRKYRSADANLVRDLAAGAVAKFGDPALAEAEVRRALHLSISAPCPEPLNVPAWTKRFAACAAAGERNTVCRDLLQRHASTRERLPEMEAFFAGIFAAVGPVESILDLGCGVNPAALPWMGLPAGVRYHAMDARSDVTGVIQAYFNSANVDGVAEPANLLGPLPSGAADAALLLKLLPALERLQPGSALQLMQRVPAPTLVVSFPARSFGGARRGMRQNYGQALHTWLADEPWTVDRLDFRTETAFIVRKQR